VPRGLSVVIPVYRDRGTLFRALDALEPQIADAAREVIVVESSGDETAPAVARRYPWARVIALSDRASYGRAVNLGAEIARGESIVVMDADALPQPGCLNALEQAGLRAEAVAGAVLNGPRGHPIAAAGHLLEFSNWLPGKRRAQHAAGCNFLVRRSAWRREGGFPEDVWTGADTTFSLRFGIAGTLAWAPDARVRHLNRTSLRGYLREQHKHGVGAVQIARGGDFPHAWVFRPALAPLAAGVKLLGVLRSLRRPVDAASMLLLSPLLLLGLVAWAVGVARSSRLAHLPLPVPAHE